MASDNQAQFDAACACGLQEPVVCKPKCPENDIDWDLVFLGLQALIGIGICVLCVLHPDDLNGEPEEIKLDHGWRPMPDEAGEPPEPEAPKLDIGWVPLEREPAEVEPEEYPPNWGWRPKLD